MTAISAHKLKVYYFVGSQFPCVSVKHSGSSGPDVLKIIFVVLSETLLTFHASVMHS